MGASKPDEHTFAVLSLLLSATLWGLVWYPLRLLETAGLDGLWVSLAAYAAALLTGLPVLWRMARGGLPAGPWLYLMALASGWLNVSFILAMLDGTVVRVLLLFFLSPLWSLLLARLLLGERLQRGSVFLMALALTGALVMLWNPTLGWPWPQEPADWLALSSGFAFALTNVLARRLEQVSLGVKTLYGVSRLPVQRSAIILPVELVVGALSAWWLAEEMVHRQEWIGGALIVTAAFISARRRGGV
ncbi:MAG: EamA family transporter [Xanthomonadaceae bacterium]|nr:EamA family transporter [Xanthomonadaceae bacterium]